MKQFAKPGPERDKLQYFGLQKHRLLDPLFQ